MLFCYLKEKRKLALKETIQYKFLFMFISLFILFEKQNIYFSENSS